MEHCNRKILIAGGSGFVVSHLTEELLLRGNKVVVADNFSTGKRKWIPEAAEIRECDLSNFQDVQHVFADDIDITFHLAARSKTNDNDPHEQFDENTSITHNILRAAGVHGVTNIAYTSSSTVYGEAPTPTPEDYAPLEPISIYGASKLADEALLSTYAHSHGFTVWNFRFANVVGPRLRGAVIPDFIEKLRSNPETLTILGNGQQEKSYLHINDCIDAMCHVISELKTPPEDNSIWTFNLGSKTTTSVTQIAEIVSDELDLDPEFQYTGGERGWMGDVPKMRLSIEKIRDLGWHPEYDSQEAVRRATKVIADEIS